MSQINKLMDSIRELNPNLRFDELAKVLIQLGYIPNQPRGGSSHYTFRKQGKEKVTIPKTNHPAQQVYIKRVRDILLLEESENH